MGGVGRSELAGELPEAMRMRAGFYRMLASVFFKGVSVEFVGALAGMRLPDLEEGTLIWEGYRELRGYLARRGPDPRTDLAVDYARVFLAAGIYEGEAANPYESIYTSEEGLIMQDARDEVRRIYIRQGVNVDAGLNLPEDHLSFECEFMAIMSDRAADLAASADASGLRDNLVVQRAFASAHLANWLPDLRKRVDAVARCGFYPAFMKIAMGYVEQDLSFLADLLDPLDALPDGASLLDRIGV